MTKHPPIDFPTLRHVEKAGGTSMMLCGLSHPHAELANRVESKNVGFWKHSDCGSSTASKKTVSCM